MKVIFFLTPPDEESGIGEKIMWLPKDEKETLVFYLLYCCKSNNSVDKLAIGLFT